MEKDIIERLDRIEKLSILAAKNVLNIDDVAILTGMSKGYVYQLTHDKKIPFYKPTGKQIYFKRSEVEEWMTRNRYNSVDEAQSKAVSYVVRKDGIIGNTENTAEYNSIKNISTLKDYEKIKSDFRWSLKLYCDILNGFLHNICKIIPTKKIRVHEKNYIARWDIQPLKEFIKGIYEQKAKEISDDNERIRFFDKLLRDYEIIDQYFDDMKYLAIGQKNIYTFLDDGNNFNFAQRARFIRSCQNGFFVRNIKIDELMEWF